MSQGESSAAVTNRGARSRQRIKEACAQVLEREGYRALRVVDVAAEADVPISLLYHYYPDLESLAMEVLQEAVTDMMERLRLSMAQEGRQRGVDGFDPLQRATEVLARQYAERPGIMRSLLQLEDSEPRFAAFYQEVSAAWSQRVAANTQRRFADAGVDPALHVALAHTLGGMVDRALFDLYVQPVPDLADAGRDPARIARFLSILWYRIVFLANPPGDQLGDFQGMSGLKA
ncbi:TetR/AcrR family transcriptional regulator [Niveispirillum sp. KHB5.9]|uniref:TetR/AcrR family transcriptional regulator n=1 Tax=Niveispirillum sp. KHB5.9 TaxID=3400269 RepID=UPI003A8AEFBB